MRKQPDLIAAEMQADARIPPEVTEAVSKLYERRDDPDVKQALQTLAKDSKRGVMNEEPQLTSPGAPPSEPPQVEPPATPGSIASAPDDAATVQGETGSPSAESKSLINVISSLIPFLAR
jgi:hypothetical protein